LEDNQWWFSRTEIWLSSKCKATILSVKEADIKSPEINESSRTLSKSKAGEFRWSKYAYKWFRGIYTKIGQ
jgi:hypothetical protein